MLFQRKVKARSDGGKITSDAGVLLLRGLEKRTDLIDGLTRRTDRVFQRLPGSPMMIYDLHPDSDGPGGRSS